MRAEIVQVARALARPLHGHRPRAARACTSTQVRRASGQLSGTRHVSSMATVIAADDEEARRPGRAAPDARWPPSWPSRPTASRASNVARGLDDDRRSRRAGRHGRRRTSSSSATTSSRCCARPDVVRRVRIAAAARAPGQVLRLKADIRARARRGESKRATASAVLRERMQGRSASELGEQDDDAELDELRTSASTTAKMTDEARKVAAQAGDARCARSASSSPEHNIARTYLEKLLEIPWGETTEDTLDVAGRARDPRGRPRRPREGEEAHPRVHRGAQARAGQARPDPVPRRPARRRQDLARPVDRAPRSAASTSASRSAACATRPRSAATGAPTSARCPAASSRASRRPARMNPVFVLDEIDKLSSRHAGRPGRGAARGPRPRAEQASSSITTSRCRSTCRR